MSTIINKNQKQRRKIRNFYKIKSNNKKSKPIIQIHRSNTNIYAQIIDSISGKVLESSSSLVKNIKENKKGNRGVEIASMVGKDLAKKALKKGIKEVVFNKGSYAYLGRVKSLSESCKKEGLSF